MQKFKVDIKKRIFLSILLVICFDKSGYCQEQPLSSNYEISVYGGWLTTLAKRGAKEITPVSEVKFLKPVTKTFGAAFDLNIKTCYFIGLAFVYDEFDYGYEAASRNVDKQGVGFSSGLLAASDRVCLYKAGLRMGYKLPLGERFEINGIIIPTLAYSKYSGILADTLTLNKSEWADYYRSEIVYIKIPPEQNTGIKFLVNSSLEGVYKFKRHFALSLSMSYQQGFKQFLKDEVNIIRPHEASGPQQAIYYSQLKGTSLQWHFGLKYRFS